MKAKLICLLMVLTLCFGSLGAFTACNPAPPTVSVRANAVSVSLLDGKIANFMGCFTLWNVIGLVLLLLVSQIISLV